MRVGEWPDLEKMSRESLDEIEPTRPLAIFFAGFHSLCANSLALVKLGFEAEGHSGVLEEADCFASWVKMNQVPESALDAAVDIAARNAACAPSLRLSSLYLADPSNARSAMGITQIVDLEMAFNLNDWQRRVKNGSNHLRVRCGMYEAHIGAAIEAGHKSGELLEGTEGLVEVGPFKVRSFFYSNLPHLDAYVSLLPGHYRWLSRFPYRLLPPRLPRRAYVVFFCFLSSISCLASLLPLVPQAYHSPSAAATNFGRFEYPVPTLKTLLETATANSFNLAVHALGDKAISLSLECIASLSTPHLPGSSIEHAQLLAFDNGDIELFKKLGLIASIQPLHMVDDIELSDKYFAGRTQRSFAFKTMADAGIELKMGSDAPVAVVDPFVFLLPRASCFFSLFSPSPQLGSDRGRHLPHPTRRRRPPQLRLAPRAMYLE
jgi:predicted amidohydrolase YtcJ